ncbi:MAG: VWA domain-containing protein [Alphaproteobacteria bacterium]|nr:VWA domain-containing protein [Alphaproteobacteria bacterium]
MNEQRPLATPDNGDSGGRLAENIMHFARVLRAAGLPIGPGRVLNAINAVRTVGIGDRGDFYWTLHAVFINRRDQRELFDQAFHIFWRNPRILERMMAMALPTIRVPGMEEDELSRRVAEALGAGREPGQAEADDDEPPEEIVIDAAMTWSDRELLQSKDFEKMSAEEIARARAIIARMHLPIMVVPTRRFRPNPHGQRIDMRGTLRKSLRSGGRDIPLARRSRRWRHPPLVILCDISGSMSRYSRMLLHFMHVLTNDRDRVHTFLFGTRLTNITRHLRNRDIDLALDKITGAVEDWSGGTRIGSCLMEFNRIWSRRVLAQGAVVMLITDGLDREEGDHLEAAIERLHKSCRRLVWLNPLLRYEGFEPKSQGIKTIMPHVDEFRPVHNLNSLIELAAALGRPRQQRVQGAGKWREMVK